MTRRIVVILLVLAVVAGGAAVVVHRKRALEHLETPERVPIPVSVEAVRDGTVAEAVRTVALIQAESATTVAAQVAGVLTEVRRREGDRVERGALLARIDARTLDDAVASARARHAAALEELTREQAVHRRDETLFAGKAISRQAFEASSAQLEAARASEIAARRALESVRTARGYADVVAPYRGVVTARLVEPGDLATPGKPLFAIQGPASVKLLSKLSQSSLALIAPGASVTFSDGNDELRARVTRVYPALDAARLGSVETLVAEAPFGLRPGSVVGAVYGASAVRGLVVPSLALLEGLQETLVVRVRDGRADPVPVTVAARGAREAVVEGEVKPGDLVVTGLPSELMALTAGTPLQPSGGADVAREGRP